MMSCKQLVCVRAAGSTQTTSSWREPTTVAELVVEAGGVFSQGWDIMSQQRWHEALHCSSFILLMKHTNVRLELRLKPAPLKTGKKLQLFILSF